MSIWPSSRSSSIVRDVNYGWLLRNMHASGASMFFIAVYIHMFRGLYYGSYKAPREILWILGVILYLLMMATGFMGYVLPWGQMSFWGATVITNLVLGHSGGRRQHRDAAVGRLFGRQPDAEPLLLAALPSALRHRGRRRAAHLGAACRRPEQSGRRRAEDGEGCRAVHALRDGQGRVRHRCCFLFFSWFIFYMPNYLGDPENFIPANPAVTPQHIVPEWYYLPFYAILRGIPSKLGGVIAMFSAIIVLAFLPWLDSAKTRSSRYRPVAKQFFWIFVLVCVLLGWLGAKPAEGIYVIGLARPDVLLLRLFPDRAAAAQPHRDAASGSELDRGRRAVEGQVEDRGIDRRRVYRRSAGCSSPRRSRRARLRITHHAGAAVAEMVLRGPVRHFRSWLSCSAASRSTGKSARPAHSLKLRCVPQSLRARRPGIQRRAGRGTSGRIQGAGRSERCRRDVRAPGSAGGSFPGAVPERQRRACGQWRRGAAGHVAAGQGAFYARGFPQFVIDSLHASSRSRARTTSPLCCRAMRTRRRASACRRAPTTTSTSPATPSACRSR